MTKLEDYKDLQENCSILLGQIAETSAKTKLLQNRLSRCPEEVDEISNQIEKLELEMIIHIKSIQNLDEKLK